MGLMTMLRKRRKPRKLLRSTGSGILLTRHNPYGLGTLRKLQQRNIMNSTRRRYEYLDPLASSHITTEFPRCLSFVKVLSTPMIFPREILQESRVVLPFWVSICGCLYVRGGSNLNCMTVFVINIQFW